MSSPLEPLPSWDSEKTWATFEEGSFHGYIRGTEVQKSPDDLERYRELVEASEPDLIIETGTRAGGSALYFTYELGLDVITIDKNPQWRTRGAPPDLGGWIDWVIGGSTDQWVLEHVRTRVERFSHQRIMVTLDSDHHAAHVEQEIRMWAPLVTEGCYLVVEDACFDMWEPDRARVGGGRIPEEGGPLVAINNSRTLLRQLGFRRDVSLEGFSPVSHSPVGWWRRDG